MLVRLITVTPKVCLEDSIELIKYKFQSNSRPKYPDYKLPLVSPLSALSALKGTSEYLKELLAESLPQYKGGMRACGLRTDNLVGNTNEQFCSILIQFLRKMIYSASSEHFHDGPTIRLQHVIHEFKKKQLDKSALQRKLHILKNKCESNRKRAKVVQTQIFKLKQTKEDYNREKQELNRIQSLEAELHSQKIKREKTLRQQSKENMSVIRNLIAQQRSQEYQKLKKRERIDEARITQNFNRSINEKRQKSLEVKLQQQEGRLSRTIYLEKKRINAQKRTERELLPLEAGLQKTNQYIQQMRALEQQMTEHLYHSQASLKSSKLSLKQTLK